MATGYITLPIAGCILPDDSANNNAAQLQAKSSSGGTLKPRWVEALFDPTADEHIFWSFIMPGNYASAPILKVYYKMTSAIAGDVYFGGLIMAVTDADAQDVDADTFAAANLGNATVPGTAGYMDVISITLTNADNVAAGDHVVVCLYRDADNASDTATGDAEVINVELSYTTG
jgi:hypothetical protein